MMTTVLVGLTFSTCVYSFATNAKVSSILVSEYVKSFAKRVHEI